MGLAVVMGKEKTGRTLELRDNNALSAVNNKDTALGHLGQRAKVDSLLLDVTD